jgi:hypothetical protein
VGRVLGKATLKWFIFQNFPKLPDEFKLQSRPSIGEIGKLLCPQISALAISTSEKWARTVLEIEIPCNHLEGSASTHEWSNFFLVERGKDKEIFSPLVLNVFPIKRWNLGVHISFYFFNWGPKRCFNWGHAQCFKKIANGPINIVLFKNNLWMHPWSN